jgi:hypothetical protein
MAGEERLQSLSLATQAGLATIVLGDVTAAALGFPFASFLASVPQQTPAELLATGTSALLYSLPGLFQALALLGTAILFLFWFHRVYSNVAAITGQTTRHAPKWTIWGFFVPFLNVIRPQQIMRESWDAMLQHWLRNTTESVARIPRDLVNVWWGLFILTRLAEYFAARIEWRAEVASDMLVAVRAAQVANAIDALAAVVAILLVRNVTSLQRLVMSAPAVPASLG